MQRRRRGRARLWSSATASQRGEGASHHPPGLIATDCERSSSWMGASLLLSRTTRQRWRRRVRVLWRARATPAPPAQPSSATSVRPHGPCAFRRSAALERPRHISAGAMRRTRAARGGRSHGGRTGEARLQLLRLWGRGVGARRINPARRAGSERLLPGGAMVRACAVATAAEEGTKADSAAHSTRSIDQRGRPRPTTSLAKRRTPAPSRQLYPVRSIE